MKLNRDGVFLQPVAARALRRLWYPELIFVVAEGQILCEYARSLIAHATSRTNGL